MKSIIGPNYHKAYRYTNKRYCIVLNTKRMDGWIKKSYIIRASENSIDKYKK